MKKGLLVLFPLIISALAGCNSGEEATSSATTAPAPTSSSTSQDLYPPKRYESRATVPAMSGSSISVAFTFDDRDFDASAKTFNKQIALASYLAACSSDTVSNWKNYFSSIGFGGYQAGEGEYNDLVLAYKFVNDYALVAPAFRSLGYGEGWANNVTVGLDGDHEGFQETVKKMVKMIDNSRELQGKKLKFWCAGYSRGAALAGAFSTYIMDNKLYGANEENVFCYAFEAPKYVAEDIEYENIFNFYNEADIVPAIFPDEYGLSINGQRIVLDIEGIDDVAKEAGYELEPFVPVSGEKGFQTESEFLSKFIQALLTEEKEGSTIHYSLSTREKYVENYQDKLVYSMKLIFKMPSSALPAIMQEVQDDPTIIFYALFTRGVDNPIYQLIKKYLDLYHVEYDEAELSDKLAGLIDNLCEQLVNNVSQFLDLFNTIPYITRVVQFHYPEINYLLLKRYLENTK